MPILPTLGPNLASGEKYETNESPSLSQCSEATPTGFRSQITNNIVNNNKDVLVVVIAKMDHVFLYIA